MNVLLAEDNDDLAEMMLMLVQSTYNIKVVWKPDGKAALAEFKSCEELNGGKYNFVITDRNMPKMSGIELAESLNILDPSTPIVLWTSDYPIPTQASHLFKEVVLKSNTLPWIDHGLQSYLT